MNSFLTKRWLLPALVTAFVLLVTVRGTAQPCSIGATSNPLNLELTINSVTGTATLTSSDLIGFYTTDCGVPVPGQLPFFADQAMTTFYGTYNPACLVGSSITYTCADVNSTITFWVAIHDGQTNGNPLNCEYDPTTLSEAAEVRVTVRDKTGPNAAAPANITVNADAGVCTATGVPGIAMSAVAKGVYLAAPGTYTDNCLSNLSISYQLSGATVTGLISGSNAGVQTFNKGTTTVTYTITDLNYTPGSDLNPITVVCTVTVNDAEAPVLTCPAGPINVNTDAGLCTSAVDIAVSATDNCPGVPTVLWSSKQFASSPGIAFGPNPNCPGGITDVIPVAGVGVLNYPSGIRLAGVTLNIAHTFRGDLEVQLEGPGGVPILVLANDIDGSADNLYTVLGESGLVVNDPGACGSAANCTFGPTTATFYVPQGGAFGSVFNGIDANGNWTLRVCDDEVLDAGALVSWSLNFEGFSTPGIGFGNLTDVVFPLGSTTVNFVAYDAVGNTDDCAVVVNVTDNEDPQITCHAPANITVAADAVACTYTVSGTAWDATSTDNCSISAFSNNYTATATLNGAVFPIGTTVVTWTVQDGSGNFANCAHSITVTDQTAPVVTPFPPPTFIDFEPVYNVSATPGDCSAAVSFYRPSPATHSVVENCSGPVTVTEGPAIVNGVADPVFLTVVTPYPYDYNNPLHWTTPVVVQCPIGTTVIPYYYEDAVGNTTTITVTINVSDNIAPTAVCKPNNTVVLTLDANGDVTVDPAMIDNGSSDNCPGFTLSVSPSTFSCPPVPGNQLVTLTVTDAAQPMPNVATCQTTVKVVDNIIPDIVCPASVTIPANMGCAGTTAAGNLSAGVFGALTTGQYADNCSVSAVTWTLSGATVASSPGTGLNTDLSAQLFNNGTTTVTYTIKDAATPTNQKSCNFNVTISDLTGPVFNYSASNVPDQGVTITLNANLGGCQAQIPAATWGANPTVSDACSNPSMIISQTHFPGAFFPFGMTTVTYLAKDNAGNISTYSFNVNVVDTQNPDANCQNLTVYLNPTSATVTPLMANLNSTDNCFFTYESLPVTYTCANIPPAVNNYKLKIKDASGNVDSCFAVITVLDTIKPVANCTSISEIFLDGTGNASYTAVQLDAGSTDNCGITQRQIQRTPPGSAFGSSVSFNCSDLSTPITLTLKVTDASGNFKTCTRSITVRDLIPPTFTFVPANVTVNCNAVPPVGTPTATDNCGTPSVVLQSEVITNIICVNKYTITRTWKATDAQSNMTLATQVIVVTDNVAPAFHIQNTINLLTNSANCTVSKTLSLTLPDSVSNNCSGGVNVGYTLDYPPLGSIDLSNPMANSVNGIFPIGTSKLVWTANDGCGNTSTFTVNVVVTDNFPPQYVNGYQATCGDTITLPNVTNNCGNTLTWQRPNFLSGGMLGGAISDCLPFTVTEVISNTTVQQSINASNPFNYYSSQFNQPFPSAFFPVGYTSITYTATDAVGNSSTCKLVVYIEDLQAPVLSCPNNQILAATCPDAQVPDYRNLVIVNDNCLNNVTLTQVPAPGTTTLGMLFNPPMSGNTFTVTVTATDGYNTTNACPFTVTLQDGQAPIPTVAQLPAVIDSCGFYIVYAPTATDPCHPGAPIIYGTPSAPVGQFLPGTPPRYKLLPGNYVITWVYDDGNGNVSSQPQNITVLADIYPPVALCKPGFTVNLGSAIPGTASITLGQVDNGSYDQNQCGSITLALNKTAFTCADLNLPTGVNVVTLTVTDTSGNTSTCTTPVTVKDVTKPVFTSVPPDVTLEACTPLPSFPFPTAADNCSVASLVADTASTQTASGYGFYNYSITLTYTATDASGNSRPVIRNITVEDSQAPEFDDAAPDTIIVYTDPGSLICADTVSLDLSAFIDDCSPDSTLAVSNTAYPLGGADASGLYYLGTTTVYFLAEDLSGNFSSHSVTVIVRDGTPPTAVCINGVSAALQPSGFVNVTVNQFNNNSFDNCTDDTDLELLIQRLDQLPLQQPSGSLLYTCADADGVTHHPVKLFVTDTVGNMSMCETYIVIQDNVPPVIVKCPDSKTIQCSDNMAPSAQGTAVATDNCTVASITYHDTLTAGMGAICQVLTRTWLVRDQANNLTTCTQILSIQDTIKPVFSQLPGDVTVSCSDVIAPPQVATATDNCDPNVTITFVQDTINIAAGLCGKYSYTITRIRTATDDCGNSAVHSRKITVTDTQAPKFLGMPDTVEVFSSNFPPNLNCTVPVNFNVAQFLSDCAPVNELLVTNDAPLGDTSLSVAGNYGIGNYKVHFSATDPCGNTGVDSILLVVVDNSVPTTVCNGNVVVALGTNGEATITPDDINLGSTDNCAIDTMFLSQSTFDCGQLGSNAISLTVVDVNGNSNSCTVNVTVELGPTAGFNLASTGSTVSHFDACNGTATATPSGGTGPYTYDWSNGDDTQTITGLNAGLYVVTVVDESTGCQRIDTVEVLQGPKLTLSVGTAAGAQGATVSVPVTADNFVDIYGFTFSVGVNLPTVGTIVGVSGVNATLAPAFLPNVGGGVASVLWATPSALPFTLPNGTILFYVDVLLDDAAPVGSSSPVDVTGVPVAIDFLQDICGTPESAELNTVSGSVSINSLANDLVIAGDIKTWVNPEVPTSVAKPVQNVTVTLSGGASGSEITGVPGTYDFDVASGVNTSTNCAKTTAGNAGITAGDLLRIVNHIFGDTLPSPYQWVAADVNNSKTVSLADYLLIQRVVLGTDQHLLNQLDWKFVPKTYTFPANSTPAFGPLTNPVPSTIDHNPILADELDDDFVAVRMGDVNGNTPVNFNDDADDRYGDNNMLHFSIDDKAVNNGEVFEVPFKASDFRNRQAYQLTIAFDPAVLSLEGVTAGALPKLGDDNFGMAHLDQGYLTTVWVSADPVSLNDGEVLFTLRFRALRSDKQLSDVLQAGSQITRAETYTQDGATQKVEFRYEKAGNSQEVSPFVLYQNMPNPFRNGTSIAFRLPESGRATLRVFNTSGQIVKMVVGEFEKGYNELNLRKDDFGAPGVYWYELETPTHSDRKKMILID